MKFELTVFGIDAHAGIHVPSFRRGGWLEIVSVTVLLLAAGFLCLYRLDTVPPGLSDAATNGLDIQQLLAGHLRLFFPANHGREALFIYFQALLTVFAGMHPIVFAFSSVVMAMLTVALTYRLFKAQFGASTAFLAAALLSFSFWNVDMSRQGLRATSLPPLLLATLYFERRLLRLGHRRDALLGGLTLGLSLYTYIAARIVPALVVFLALADWATSRKHLAKLAVLLLVGGIVAAPEGGYFLVHRDQLFLRSDQVSVFSAHPQMELFRDAPVQSLRSTSEVFFVRGDPNPRYNIPYRPIFDPVLGALFVIGAGMALWRSRSSVAHRWALIWLVTMWMPSALSTDSPDTLRALSAAPVTFLMPALVMQWLAEHRRPVSVLLAALLFFETATTFQLFFHQWADDPRTDAWFGGRELRIAKFLAARPETVRYLSDDLSAGIRVLFPASQQDGWVRESSRVVPLPSRPEDTLYLAVTTAALSDLVGQELPGAERLPSTFASSGEPDFLAYRWPASAVARFQSQQRAVGVDMGGQLELVSYELTRPSSQAVLEVAWKQLRPAGPYDVFVHLLDASGRQVGQSDLVVWPIQRRPGSTGLEDGPITSGEFLTQHVLQAPPGVYVAEIGVNRRSRADVSQLVGGAISAPVRVPVRIG